MIAALFLFATLALAFQTRSAQQTLDQRLLAESVIFASTVDPKSGAAGSARALTVRGSSVVLYRNDHVLHTIGEAPDDKAFAAAARLALDIPATIVTDETYRVVVRAVPKNASLRVAVFGSEDAVDDEIGRLRRTLALAGIPLIAVAIVAGYILARRALLPIDRLIRTADTVSRTGHFSERFLVTTSDELGRLGAAFNAMLERLESTYERERTFIGDVSHEVRQPLTAIAGEAQLALRGGADRESLETALRRIDAQSGFLRELIDDLLLLARADSYALGTGTAEIGEVVAEAANKIRVEFPHIIVSVVLMAEPLFIGLSAPIAIHLIANIVRNAAQAARSSVHVEIARTETTAVVTIDDDGNGIPVAERGRVFRRFERLQAGRDTGTGLGLAIAAAIARVGGGSIAIEAAPKGGTRMRVTLTILV